MLPAEDLREDADDLLQAGPPPRDLLCDKGFNGRAFAAAQAARGTAVLVPPAKDQQPAGDLAGGRDDRARGGAAVIAGNGRA